MPPHPTFASPQGLRANYLQLVGASPVPAVLYKRDGLPSDDVLVELAGTGGVAGVRYGDTDVNSFSRCVSRAPDDSLWTCGVAERWAAFFHLAGSGGFTSGLANFVPALALALFEALQGGDYETTMRLRATCLPFEEIRARERSANNVAAVKTAMDMLGLAVGKVRPPLRDLDPATAKEVQEAIAEWT